MAELVLQVPAVEPVPAPHEPLSQLAFVWQAVPVVLVKPNAAAFARTSFSSVNVSTGMTLMPAPRRPVNRAVL